MEDYEVKVESNNKRNEKYINEFENWLNDKNLVSKTISKHISNIDLYLNHYLNYYDVITMEDGVHEVYDFLSDWFVRKCMWSSENSIKENAASIKKFYQCMSEKGYISNDDYKDLCSEIKDNMDEFIDAVEAFDNGSFYDDFI